METQKDALKSGRLDAVLRTLSGRCEPPEVDDEHAPVRTCHRYLSARADRLNYRQALAEGLPIGSGEIESAHRYVAQQRLKRPGAWWRIEHARLADKPNQRRLGRLLESPRPATFRRR